MPAPPSNTLSESRPSPPEYRRVKSQNGGLLSFASLWLADDHVLQISSSWGIQENYQRVYFRDLKAVLVTDSSKRDMLFFGGICSALFFGFLAFIVTLTETSGFGMYFLWFLTLASFATAIIAYLRGRRRKVYAVTGLQTVYWRPLARQWQVDQLLAQLRPLIEAAQATLPKPEPARQPAQQQPQQQPAAPAPEPAQPA